MTAYQARIAVQLHREGIAGVDPRHVEAFIRVGYGTLDHLSSSAFTEEVRISAQCVRAIGKAEAEALAQSFGLGGAR